MDPVEELGESSGREGGHIALAGELKCEDREGLENHRSLDGPEMAAVEAADGIGDLATDLAGRGEGAAARPAFPIVLTGPDFDRLRRRIKDVEALLEALAFRAELELKPVSALERQVEGLDREGVALPPTVRVPDLEIAPPELHLAYRHAGPHGVVRGCVEDLAGTLHES